MKIHPVHPMLVHAPIACWLLTSFFDALAIATQGDFFWQVAALMAAVGVAAGALAAMAGAMDFSRAQSQAPKLVLAHASLMSGAWVLALVSLIGRVNASYQAILPAPWWAVTASATAVLLMIVGAWCGGEMVYGRGIGVDRARNGGERAASEANERNM
jgi:uncharacterized membrane protein